MSYLDYFTRHEFRALNCGDYHDVSHPVITARVVGEMARRDGRDPARVRFLQQVAFVHDADPRLDPETGTIRPGTRARVPATLEWMDVNRDELLRRFGWSVRDFREAKALIARTEFPYDDQTRPSSYRDVFQESTPVALYRDLLKEVPEEDRAATMRDAAILRFADQVSHRLGSFESAEQALAGLVQELNREGNLVTLEAFAKTVPKFLAEIAVADVRFDREVARELKIDARLPGREELLNLLPGDLRENFQANVSRYLRRVA